LPPRAREVERLIERLGFVFQRQEGSHRQYEHQDGRHITIPFHGGRDLNRDVVRSIVLNLEITRAEFNRLLRGR